MIDSALKREYNSIESITNICLYVKINDIVFEDRLSLGGIRWQYREIH